MPMLLITLASGEKSAIDLDKLALTGSSEVALRRFLERAAPFDKPWVPLNGGTYVRYDQIVSVKIDP